MSPTHDELGLFGSGDSRSEPPLRSRRELRELHDRRRRAKRRSGRRKVIVWTSVLVVLVVAGLAAWFGLRQLLDIGSYDDYAGAGESDVVVEVSNGQTTGAIAARLQELDVVASSRAFVKAGESESKVRGIQPGFYVMKTKMSGKDAVARMVDPASRVGRLEIRAGSQLDDVTKLDGGTNPGIVSLLAKASCAELNGASTCVAPQELQQVAETADLASLGVPDWAVAPAGAAEPKHRLEGLILPNVYDVRPGANAQELWKSLLTASAAQLQSIGMPDVAAATGFTPYQVTVMASLVEREAILADFAKVSRVTYNRLAKPMPLQYDSTINYVLDRPMIATSDADRSRSGPYNSYRNEGLPPTPIGSPSKEAFEAVVKPADGAWIYFVKCETNGSSCFAVTDAEHQANVQKARANGVF